MSISLKSQAWSESDLSDIVLERLSKDFHYKEQVWGNHFSGQKKRVDAVIWPKDLSQWANKDIMFGIEFKKPLVGEKDMSSMIRQAYDYLYTKFDGFGYMPILVCPLILRNPYSSTTDASFVRRLIGRFGIGEIRNSGKNYRGLQIVFQDQHVIWDEKYGVCEGKKWKLIFNQ